MKTTEKNNWKIEQIRAYIEASQSKEYDVYLVQKKLMNLDNSLIDANFGYEVLATNPIGILTDAENIDNYEMYRWEYVINGDFDLILISYNVKEIENCWGQIIEILDCNTLMTQYKGINIF